MTSEKKWNYNSEEEKKLADHIISLEKAAFEKWFKGDTSGYAELWSKKISLILHHAKQQQFRVAM